MSNHTYALKLHQGHLWHFKRLPVDVVVNDKTITIRNESEFFLKAPLAEITIASVGFSSRGTDYLINLRHQDKKLSLSYSVPLTINPAKALRHNKALQLSFDHLILKLKAGGANSTAIERNYYIGLISIVLFALFILGVTVFKILNQN